MDVLIFLVFALVAVVCAINVVVQSHPISSALSLIGVKLSAAWTFCSRVAVCSQPMTTLAVAAVVGFVVGAMWKS